MRFTSQLLTTLFGVSVLASGVTAADNEVVVIPLTWDDQVYYQTPNTTPEILPCEPPNLPVAGGADLPMAQGFSNNEMVFSQPLKDPRLMLVEDPKPDDPSRIVSSIDFKLHLPWTGEYSELRFFGQLDQQEPDVVVDLSDAIGAYREDGGRDAEASCQYPEKLQADRDAINLDKRISEALQQAESESEGN